MDKKKLILRILFILTFLPYVLLLGFSTLSMYTGFTFIGSTEYGFEAFTSAFIIVGFAFCYTGIIPVCAIIQIGVLIYHLVNRDRTKKLSKNPFVIGVSVIAVIVLGFIIWNLCEHQIKELFAKPRAISMYERSEEIIPYNYNLDTKIFNDDRFTHETILIDMDKKEIGFVMYDASDRFVVYELEPADLSIADRYYLQSSVVLDDGFEFYSYTDLEGYSETTLVIVITPDGTVYNSFMHVCEFLHLNEHSFDKR